ncbi:hypothetical protein SCH4B_0154 [Ruegeria sp. TrichCH4B]|nr:hypothetical protein SCH4B_0154 [Ruegeria sp. TrichCH4B]
MQHEMALQHEGREADLRRCGTATAATWAKRSFMQLAAHRAETGRMAAWKPD